MTFSSPNSRCTLVLRLSLLVWGPASMLFADDSQDGPEHAAQFEEKRTSDEPDRSTGVNSDLDSGPLAAGTATGDILDLDIEQLGQVQAKVATAFDVEVTSVTANKSSIGKSPAAVFVITNDMIRRSGATSIPETFRMVPGMQVAKIGASKWAISARGFNNQFSTKLLVLIDGRSIYSSFDAGVYWESQDLVLQDIERIEVIRGPGATIWGANAVNGVINIITKTSADTQGAQVTAGGGDQDRSINSVRYGGQIGENTHYRIYAKNTERAAGFDSRNTHDDWRAARGGFRVDWQDPCKLDLLTLQGDIYTTTFGEAGTVPQPNPPFFSNVFQDDHSGGGNVLGRWTRAVSDDNTYSFQAFFDRSQRVDTDFNFAINTYDVEFRQTLKHADSHVFTWGAGYRMVTDNIQPSRPDSGVDPPMRNFDLASLFVQEEMPLWRDDLRLNLGSKFQYYQFTGFEYQPCVQVMWEIDEDRGLWGSVSRAVRTPSRIEENATFTVAAAPAPLRINLIGGGATLVSEELLSYELGYRQQVTEQLSFEAATFFNLYHNLIGFVPVSFVPGFPAVLTNQFQNSQDAQTYGIELNAQWEVCQNWRLRGWYSFLNMQLTGTNNMDAKGMNPANQAYLMSSWDLPHQLELDIMSRYVENLPALNVPSYISADARLGWRPHANWDFSIIGQNLLAPHHTEFVGITTVPSAVNRGVYAQVVWHH